MLHPFPRRTIHFLRLSITQSSISSRINPRSVVCNPFSPSRSPVRTSSIHSHIDALAWGLLKKACWRPWASSVAAAAAAADTLNYLMDVKACFPLQCWRGLLQLLRCHRLLMLQLFNHNRLPPKEDVRTYMIHKILPCNKTPLRLT